MRPFILKSICSSICFFVSQLSAHRVRPHVQLQTQAQPYKITILVVRHGMSCANLIQKRSSYVDIGGRNIVDPALTGIGQHGSIEAGHAISEWLKAPPRDWDVDAIVTSVLGRAIETSLLTFGDQMVQTVGGPQSHPIPIEVVPFIRPSQSGKPRSPRDDQVKEIRKSLSRKNLTAFHIDYHWVDGADPRSEGTWEQFLAFLANMYLPATLRRLGKEPGSRLVLAVTTHNKWIHKALAKQCDFADKLRSNGVLHLEYKLHQQAASRVDATDSFKLEQDASLSCETIYEGSRVIDDPNNFKRMCVADIGDICIESAEQHAYFGSKIAHTLEGQIVDISNAMNEVETKIYGIQSWLYTSMTKILTRSAMGQDRARRELRKAKGLVADLDAEFIKLEYYLPKLQSLRDERCLDGTHPNVPSYVEHWANASEVLRGAEHWWRDVEPSVPKRLDLEIVNFVRHGTVHSPCLTVFNEDSDYWIKTVKVTESTCNEGLYCYARDGTRAKAGTKGICAIPRSKECTPKAKRDGCRPGTKCSSRMFFGPTCQDV